MPHSAPPSVPSSVFFDGSLHASTPPSPPFSVSIYSLVPLLFFFLLCLLYLLLCLLQCLQRFSIHLPRSHSVCTFLNPSIFILFSFLFLVSLFLLRHISVSTLSTVPSSMSLLILQSLPLASLLCVFFCFLPSSSRSLFVSPLCLCLPQSLTWSSPLCLSPAL